MIHVEALWILGSNLILSWNLQVKKSQTNWNKTARNQQRSVTKEGNDLTESSKS